MAKKRTCKAVLKRPSAKGAKDVKDGAPKLGQGFERLPAMTHDRYDAGDLIQELVQVVGASSSCINVWLQLAQGQLLISSVA